jgi:hypothetical protein
MVIPFAFPPTHKPLNTAPPQSASPPPAKAASDVNADAEAKTEIRSDTLSIRIGAESDCRTSTDDQVHHHAVEDHFAAGRLVVALAVICVLVVGRTQPKRIPEVDRIPARKPIEIEPAREPERIFLREDTAGWPSFHTSVSV